MNKKRILLNKSEIKVDNSDSNIKSLDSLIELFKNNLNQYTSQNYDESNTRTDFIDKFFELLGWDVRNVQGYSEQYRDVIREDKVTIEGKQKAPDYCFRIGGQRKFFVEAKKPSVNIKDDIGAAYQLRRYAYSAKLPLSILTDFHEFAIYDTRIKPRPKDKASVARIFYCKFDQYPENFNFILNTFSKEAINKGSFDKYVMTLAKKGTSEVDKEFLKLIESWRNELAKNIAVNNLKLDLYTLNLAVQKIIDRLIFLRIAEDRNIENYNNLANLAKDGNVFKKLDEYFQQANLKYNSGLFHPESWLSNLKVDDEILKDIIKSIYYPESPYEFAVLPVEILGNIYEQFLGKVIHLTASHQAKIEEKPEVKKAGGVYYTPQYIVEYIVKNTVGEKVKDSTPEKVEEIKILDPACGSGSFLLGAYDYLLKWYLDYYTDKTRLEKSLKSNKIYSFKDSYRLTLAQKKKILLDNIFGVDIDAQAVEVSKLSLLLKLMEDETQESYQLELKFDKKALLPDLSANIKCGNSLIGPDFYDGKNMSLFGNEEMRKVNVFDWQKEFKDIFDNGGFDVVIGNPPYIDSEGMVNSGQEYARDFISENYKFTKGNWDIYIAFIEAGFNLLNSTGVLAYITPDKWITKPFGDELRINLIKNIAIISKMGRKVFDNAKVDSIVTFFSKKNVKNINVFNHTGDNVVHINEVDKDILTKPYLLDKLFSLNLKLILKIDTIKNRISDFYSCENACATSDAYKIKPIIKDFGSENIDKNQYLKIINTGTIDKYISKWGAQKMTYLGDKYLYPVVNKKIFMQMFKNSYSRKSVMPKLIIKGLTLLDACIDEFGQVIPGKSTIIITSKLFGDLKKLAPIINSKLAIFYIKEKYPSSSYNQGINFTKDMILDMPLPEINERDKETLINMTDQEVDMRRLYRFTKNEGDKKLYQQKIEILDRQINKEVFKLYGLTEDEIKIIEGK